jgi:citronellol/citronellal dehydrogenase
VLAAPPAEPHPNLPGPIYTAAEEIEKAGGCALPLVVDVREEQQIAAAVDQAVAKFGGIDILVNNASAISLTGTLATPAKIYDRMMTVNTRGTYLCSQACIPALKRSRNPHILNLSPPLNMAPKWFAGHVAYTIAKYGMSLCVLGMAEEFRADGIAVNALWPRTAIATAAIEFAVGDRNMLRFCRKPEILADAAHWILTRPSRELTGRFLIDDEVLAAAGVRDFSAYAVDPAAPLAIDFFLDDPGPHVRESIRLGENPPH